MDVGVLIKGILEVGLAAALVVVLVRWMTTKMDESLKELARGQARVTRAIMAHSLLIVGLQKELLVHDLTVTGINPALGADLGERAEKAIHKYTELIEVMNRVETAIKDLGEA